MWEISLKFMSPIVLYRVTGFDFSLALISFVGPS